MGALGNTGLSIPTRFEQRRFADYCTKYYITGPFGESGEINRARLKTVRPSSSSRVQVREREFEFTGLVGGTGHYLNCEAELAGGLLGLLKTAETRLSRRRVPGSGG